MTESSSWGLWQSFLIWGFRIFLGFDLTSEQTSLGTSKHSLTGSRLGTILVSFQHLGIGFTLHFSFGFSDTICTIFSWQCFFSRLIMQFEVRGKQSFCATRLHFSLGNLLRLVRFLISQIRFGTIVQSSKTEYPLDFCWHTFSSRSWQLATLSTTSDCSKSWMHWVSYSSWHSTSSSFIEMSTAQFSSDNGSWHTTCVWFSATSS